MVVKRQSGSGKLYHRTGRPGRGRARHVSSTCFSQSQRITHSPLNGSSPWPAKLPSPHPPKLPLLLSTTTTVVVVVVFHRFYRLEYHHQWQYVLLLLTTQCYPLKISTSLHPVSGLEISMSTASARRGPSRRTTPTPDSTPLPDSLRMGGSVLGSRNLVKI